MDEDDDIYPDLRDSPYWDDECERDFIAELQLKRDVNKVRLNEQRREQLNNIMEEGFLGTGFKYVAGDPFW